MLVHEIMTSDPVSIAPSTTVKEALEEMANIDVRHLPVVSDGTLVGILSDRDLRSYLLPYLEKWDDPDKSEARQLETIESVMSTDLATLSPDSDVSEAIEIILETRVGAVPVIDSTEENLVGIVSYIDILSALQGAS